ncbi:MAG: phosphoglucosamine mutase [Desulfobacterales bacterium]
MGKLFGTDGIRGAADTYPLTPDMVEIIGRTIADHLLQHQKPAAVVVGRDTRISGPNIEKALVEGIRSMGIDVLLAGILPTPGVAFLTRALKAGAGIVISASHNPYYDNGIKLFNGDGFKFPDETESAIEAQILSDPVPVLSSDRIAQVHPIEDASAQYTDFLKRVLDNTEVFKGLRIVIDCSNGATHRIAPVLFSDLGADVETIFDSPDGKNINENCGSQHTDTLSRKVLENRADVGLAFDGDGDRLIAVDETGGEITGDRMLAISARILKDSGALKNNRVVSTVMSNMGLGEALRKMGIEHIMTQVGDRYVMEEMKRSGAILGGEDSGHMIFLNHHTTGDGIVTALNLLKAMCVTATPLSHLAEAMTVYPQVLHNVDVSSKPDLDSVPEIMDAIRRAEDRLKERGRVLVRYSGTQPQCRVMVEGASQEEITGICHGIADIISNTIGN